MIWIFNTCILISMVCGITYITTWMWEVGVREIYIHTENFLEGEAYMIKMEVLPEVTSTKLWDRLELLLFYSGIRLSISFFSAKVFILLFCVSNCFAFITGMSVYKTLWKAVVMCIMVSVLEIGTLKIMRRNMLSETEKYLLELINVTESFAVTGEEPAAILRDCSMYLKGPIKRSLSKVESYISRGWSSRMILEQLMVSLEHPKWQEFIHNLNVCSMYNSDFRCVFQSSRKSIQSYLSSQKERQAVKREAQIEMFIIVILSMVIVYMLANLLELTIVEFVWGNIFAKCCTVYIISILALFFWKINIFQKE